MHSVEELRELAASENPPAGLDLPLPEGESEEEQHNLMLARLAFELAERKRSVRSPPFGKEQSLRLNLYNLFTV